MSAISNIYLIIFLPLISSLFCQVFGKKAFPFWIALISSLATFFMALKVLPDVLIYEKIANDFQLSALSIALEFRLDVVGIIFLLLLTFIKIVILVYYRPDIERLIDQKDRKIFYSVYLLHLFALVGIFTTNNILNLFLFFEVYSFAFFATSSISKTIKISELSFRYFCLNAASSLVILFCFLAFYLSFGEVDFTKIVDALSITPNLSKWFVITIFTLLALSFTVKFFPFWLYFENLKSTNIISSYISIDSVFIKTSVGIFIILKFLYLLFGSHLLFVNFDFQPVIILLSLLIIFYSSIKLYQQKHLKTIVVYLCLNNLGFILGCIGMQTIESFQSLFYFLLNILLVNLLLFIFATFLKRNFKTSSIRKLWLIKDHHFLLVLPIKLLIFFIAAFPMSTLFFANWYFVYASMNADISIFLLIGLIVSNFMQVSLAIKLFDSISSKHSKIENSSNRLGIKEYSFYLMSFWFLITTIYLSSLVANLTGNLSFRFASFLLSNSI